MRLCRSNKAQFVEFLVSHQVLPLLTMWAGGYYHYVLIYSQQIFLDHKRTQQARGGSTLVIRHCRKIFLDAVQWRDKFVSITLIPHLTHPCRYFLKCTTGRVVLKGESKDYIHASFANVRVQEFEM